MLYGPYGYIQALIQDVSDFQARHEAQELQMKAHELMERAVPMASEAEIYQDVAQLMSQEGVEASRAHSKGRPGGGRHARGVRAQLLEAEKGSRWA